MTREEARPHRQHRLRPRPGRLAVQVGLCRGQARHHRPDQDRGARGGDPGASPATPSARAMCRRRWCEAQIADTAKARGMTETQVVEKVMLDAQPTKQFVTFDQLAGMMLYLVSDARRLGQRRGLFDRRRLDGRVAERSDGPLPAAAAPRGAGVHARARTETGDAPREGPRRPRLAPRSALDGSASACRAAARTGPSNGACSTACSRTTASSSARSPPPPPAP